MRVPATERNGMLDTYRANANSGLLRIYSGTRPTDADTALSGNTLLAELTLNATAFGAASGGVITANAITGDTQANASGTASFARVVRSNGTTVWGDLSVTATGGGGELQLATLAIEANVQVTVTSLTVTFPVGA